MPSNPSINSNLCLEELRHLWANPSSPFLLKDEEWIERSYRDPTPFWASLIALQQTIAPTHIRSQLHQHYDFYHDAVLRHIESNTAFAIVEEGGFTTPWTYKKLHRLVNFQTKQWTKYSLKSGQIVLINLPVGPHFIVALLTALRLGLTLCYLPPNTSFLPPPHILSLIDEIKPDLIVSNVQTTESYPHYKIEELLEDENNHLPHSHSYPASQIMQLSVALLRTQPYVIAPLDAQTCYLHSLRDGLLTLNLKPGVTFCAPLTSPLQSEPCTTLSTLLSGATTLHVTDQTLQKDPLLLKEEKIDILGISPQLRELWSIAPSLTSKHLKGFFIPLSTSRSHHWSPFIQLQRLEQTPSFQILVDNSIGGIALFSKPTLNLANIYVKPSLGTPWSLKNLDPNRDDSVSGFGRFYPTLSSKENSQHDYNLLLSHIEQSCLVSSTLKPCLDGVTIPIDNIENAVSQLPFVQSCLLHHTAKMGSIFSDSLVFLIFVDPLKNDLVDKMRLKWSQDINHQISQLVGSHFIPHSIEFYALSPHEKDSSIDREWCADQYQRGLLSMKRENQLNLFLSIVKNLAKQVLGK